MVNVTNHIVGIISHEVLASNRDPMIYVNYILIKLKNIEKQCLFPKTRNTYFEKSCPVRGINEGARY